jgi:hypothetical protein
LWVAQQPAVYISWLIFLDSLPVLCREHFPDYTKLAFTFVDASASAEAKGNQPYKHRPGVTCQTISMEYG